MKSETELQVVLPAEVAQIAQNVSVEKRKEVQTVLNYVFNGVAKMREQLESVSVTDENDKVNMKLANTIRLGVKQVRLNAEKTFDQKRQEVQQQMLSFKTEDALWLKAKQTMQILTKEIEENARWKEETRIRYEAAQREMKVQDRILKVSKFNPDIQRIEFENMSDESFNLFLSGIEKQYNDRIEEEQRIERERIENERLDNLERERWIEIAQFAHFMTSNPELRNMSDNDYLLLLKHLQVAKQQYEAEQEQIRKDNERLKAEREAKLKLEAEIRAKQEAEQQAEKLRIEAEKKAKAAPDKEKLKAFVIQLENIDLPQVTSEEAKAIIHEVKSYLNKLINFINDKTVKL